VAAAFGLTPAETKVVACLFAGRTLAETAATLSIADGEKAPRTHLLEDRGHAPSRADAPLDRADLPDETESGTCIAPSVGG
jgi:hypothetical protein